MKTDGEVWVYIQRQGQEIAEASLEIFSKGKDLARQLAVPVAAVVLGDEAQQVAETMSRYGAHKVYLLQAPQFEQYTTLPQARAITRLVKQYQPAIFLLAATPQGRDLAPRLASALGVGLTADCTDLRIGTYADPKTKQKHANLLLQIRPAWGGNLIATIVNPETRPQMATVREGIMRLPEQQNSGTAEIITIPSNVSSEDLLPRIIGQQITERRVNLKQAKIIVSGGAGVGTKEKFHLILPAGPGAGSGSWRNPGSSRCRFHRPRPSGRADRNHGTTKALYCLRHLWNDTAFGRHGRIRENTGH